jgi:exonuclease III
MGTGIQNQSKPAIKNYCKLRIGHLNVNAIRNEIPLLTLFISEHDFDILYLSETKVDPSTLVMSIPGYNLYRNDRTNGGGGVAILIREEFSHYPVTFDTESSLANTVELSVKVQVRKFRSKHITCLYRAKFNLSRRVRFR